MNQAWWIVAAGMVLGSGTGALAQSDRDAGSKASETAAPYLKALDQDGDGRLSERELNRAARALNRDGRGARALEAGDDSQAPRGRGEADRIDRRGDRREMAPEPRPRAGRADAENDRPGRGNGSEFRGPRREPMGAGVGRGERRGAGRPDAERPRMDGRGPGMRRGAEMAESRGPEGRGARRMNGRCPYCGREAQGQGGRGPNQGHGQGRERGPGRGPRSDF